MNFFGEEADRPKPGIGAALGGRCCAGGNAALQDFMKKKASFNRYKRCPYHY